MKTTLVIMAAGLGSRFKGGVKALSQVGPNGEIIMDYTVHDAVLAKFDRVVFIIRKEIEHDFRELIFNRISKVLNPIGVETVYVNQDINDIPGKVPQGRTKPWGTCHAVLAARHIIDGPFCVLNADDYYGKTAFRKVHYFIEHAANENEFCMAGFKVMNTLSENGGVTRGLCSLDYEGCLSNIKETKNIIRGTDCAMTDGTYIAPNTCASMNMWGFSRKMIEYLEIGMEEFIKNTPDPLDSEFLLPIFVGQLVRRGIVTVKVLPTSDKWFGVTYSEDQPLAQESIRKLMEQGVYSEQLYSDLG